MSLHIPATQFLRKTTNSPNLVVHQSWYLYTLDHWEGFWKVIHWNAACWYKQQTLAQIVLQATLHTIFEICHPILLFGTILLLNLCDLPPYTLIWHHTFIRHTRVVPKAVFNGEDRTPKKPTQYLSFSRYRWMANVGGQHLFYKVREQRRLFDRARQVFISNCLTANCRFNNG